MTSAAGAVTLTVFAVARRSGVPPAPAADLADLVSRLLEDSGSLFDAALSLADYELRVSVYEGPTVADEDLLVRQLADAQEFQLELQARLGLQTEEARRAVQRAIAAERRPYAGFDC